MQVPPPPIAPSQWKLEDYGEVATWRLSLGGWALGLAVQLALPSAQPAALAEAQRQAVCASVADRQSPRKKSDAECQTLLAKRIGLARHS